MRPSPLRSRTVVTAKRAAKVKMIAATEIRGDKSGCHGRGANPNSQRFNATKIWSIVTVLAASRRVYHTTVAEKVEREGLRRIAPRASSSPVIGIRPPRVIHLVFG